MTVFSRKTFSLNKIMIVAFLTVFVSAHAVVAWSMQSGFARETLVVAATEGTSTVKVHYIDAGQGDSILIDTPDKDVLIDGGPEDAGPTVSSYLMSTGVTHLHLMVATHMHEDHMGGLVAILSSATVVDEILVNGQTSNSSNHTSFMNLAKSHKVTVANRGQTYTLAVSANLTVFSPIQPLQFTDPDHENDNSIVVKL
jgi:competence protein ComEC